MANNRDLCVGFEQIATLTASTALAVALAKKAGRCVVQARTQAVSYTADGTTTPTATKGGNIAVGASVEFACDLTTLRFIEVVSGGKIDVHYFA